MILLLLFIILILCKAILKSKKEKKKPENMRQAAAAAKLVENEKKRLQRIQKENQRKTEKAEKQRIKKEKEIARNQARREKLQQQKQQALQDIPFYDIQLERLYISAADTRQQYKKACDSVNHDFSMNKHGAVIKDKVVNQHITDRDKALKKLITLENQIHALEKKKAAAENILTRD